jgi:hypothetical protein
LLAQKPSDGDDGDDGESSSDPPLKLVQDVKTRWNSTYDMCARLVTQRWNVAKVHGNTRLTKSSDRRNVELSPDQWEMIETLVTLLKPFKEATEILSGQQYVTLSVAETVIGKLKICVAPSMSDNDGIVEFASKLQANLNKRFDCDENSLRLLCSLLDPRYKRLKYTESETIRNKVKQVLVEKVQLFVNKRKATESEGTEPISKKQRVTARQLLLDSESSDDDETPLASASIALNAHHEVDQYLREPKCSKGSDPLQWWKEKEFKFPNVAQVARQVHCVPATSTPSERVFSSAGNIATVKRSMLKPENLDSLIFLAHNKW